MTDEKDRYAHGDIECIDAIRSALTPQEFRGFCKGNIIKYCWREQYKGGNADFEKARDYLAWAIEDDRPDLGETEVGTCTVESTIKYVGAYSRPAYSVVLSCHTLGAWESSFPPKYCPFCGKQVVKEDE